MNNLFDGICGKVAPGLCRISMTGDIAIKTSSGYRTYDPEKNRLTNCDSFVLDIGEDFFFVLPTNRVRPGDIILAGGLPKCVLKADAGTITVINFENAVVETLLPEHHMFMGNSYLYGRITSMFGKNGVKGKKGMNGIMKYMMMSAMMKGKEGGMSAMLPMLLMGGRMDFMDGLFDDEDDGKGTEDEEA
ncbi:MAG: hypothetical protein IKE30_08585 [Clostridia bacterium]|nr:hypothetical protein [Clostridia bacterium]